jgi:hypothetical protein
MKNQISSKNRKKSDRERFHEDVGVVQLLVDVCLALLIHMTYPPFF